MVEGCPRKMAIVARAIIDLCFPTMSPRDSMNESSEGWEVTKAGAYAYGCTFVWQVTQ